MIRLKTLLFRRAHRITSRREVNLYAIICDQSADRVLEDNINEKTNSSELAIDGRLLGEASEERSISELLRDAMRDFQSRQDCPNEGTLAATWPALRAQLQEAARANPVMRTTVQNTVELSMSLFSASNAAEKMNTPSLPSVMPSWRRFRIAA